MDTTEQLNKKSNPIDEEDEVGLTDGQVDYLMLMLSLEMMLRKPNPKL